LLARPGNTANFELIDWIKDLAKFDPPDRDLSVGGTEGQQPGLCPSSANFPWSM
jgi:mannose-6-phosphate isomerase-like protein (cupin superfamily)